jgi:hypothetical protein
MKKSDVRDITIRAEERGYDKSAGVAQAPD